MNGTSGRISPNAFAYYDPESRCLRTSQGTFPWDSTACSPTLPASGSMRNGRCYERQMSARATSGPDSSSLLPTPAASDGGRTVRDDAEQRGRTFYRPSGTKIQVGLDRQVKMLSTPQARDYKGVPADGFNTANLCRDVSLLPTPTAMDSSGSRNSTAKRRPDSTGNIGDTLTDAVWKTHGIPEWASVGETTSQPSTDTPPSSDDQHPDQLTIEDALTLDSWNG